MGDQHGERNARALARKGDVIVAEFACPLAPQQDQRGAFAAEPERQADRALTGRDQVRGKVRLLRPGTRAPEAALEHAFNKRLHGPGLADRLGGQSSQAVQVALARGQHESLVEWENVAQRRQQVRERFAVGLDVEERREHREVRAHRPAMRLRRSGWLRCRGLAEFLRAFHSIHTM